MQKTDAGLYACLPGRYEVCRNRAGDKPAAEDLRAAGGVVQDAGLAPCDALFGLFEPDGRGAGMLAQPGRQRLAG